MGMIRLKPPWSLLPVCPQSARSGRCGRLRCIEWQWQKQTFARLGQAFRIGTFSGEKPDFAREYRQCLACQAAP
jgi:hypothetical protein